MAAEQASAAEARFVDAIARRVVELLEGGDVSRTDTGAEADDSCLTVSQAARRYGVSRSWVYAHQRELGALRLGEGPRARLRFDTRVVAEAIAAFDRRDGRRESSDNGRARRREMRLIQFDRLE
jgi:hypothetical protein